MPSERVREVVRLRSHTAPGQTRRKGAEQRPKRLTCSYLIAHLGIKDATLGQVADQQQSIEPIQTNDDTSHIQLHSSGMLHHRRYELPILNHRPEHLRHRVLVKHALLLALHRCAHVDAAALRRRDLHAETGFRQVELARIRRVELDSGRAARDLQSERRRVCNRHRRDHRLHKHRGLHTVHWTQDQPCVKDRTRRSTHLVSQR